LHTQSTSLSFISGKGQMRRITLLYILLIAVNSCTSYRVEQLSNEELEEKALKLSKEIIIVDTHIDLPWRLMDNEEDISVRTEKGDFDYPRAVEGGLDAPFMAIFVSPREEGTIDAVKTADKLIDQIENIVQNHPDKFALAYSPKDVISNFKRGIISLPMGMENGAPINGSFENLKHFFKRGIRYITLAHSKSNHICDSSYDEDRKWKGLSPFGKELIKEMNRIGIMIDVSHITDDTFYQVMELSEVPVIASHSSCRYFTPGLERNMSDEMITLMAEHGGVIQINFGSYFLDSNYIRRSKKFREHINAFISENELKRDDPKVIEYKKDYKEKNPIGYADVSKVVDHIDHVVQIVGVDNVGLGSDFDGLGDSLPTGLKDVSMYPNILYGLLKRGYSKDDIKKICSGNILRVWQQVEDYANMNL